LKVNGGRFHGFGRVVAVTFISLGFESADFADFFEVVSKAGKAPFSLIFHVNRGLGRERGGPFFWGENG
jgi:hypothetical protein